MNQGSLTKNIVVSRHHSAVYSWQHRPPLSLFAPFFLSIAPPPDLFPLVPPPPVFCLSPAITSFPSSQLALAQPTGRPRAADRFDTDVMTRRGPRRNAENRSPFLSFLLLLLSLSISITPLFCFSFHVSLFMSFTTGSCQPVLIIPLLH